MLRALFFTFALCLLPRPSASNQNLINITANFCVNNGFKFVTYTKMPIFSPDDVSQLAVVSSKLSLRFKFLSYEEILAMANVHDAKQGDLDFEKDFVIIFMNEANIDDFKPILEVITQRRVQRTLAVLSEEQTYQMKNDLSDVQSNSNFFLLKVKPTEETEWSVIISMNGEQNVIESRMSFDKKGQFIEDYDFGGANFVYASLTWAPYLTIKNCNEKGRNCTYYGFLGDMMDICADSLNFTWDIYKDVNNSWGLFPISGPYNLSGEWGGVFGDVVTGKYPLTLSSWYWWYERHRLVDFVTANKGNYILAMIPKTPEVDYGLFVRPFQENAWLGIGGVVLIGFVSLFVPWATIPNFDHLTASQIMTTSSFYCFVLLNAFYGGALTMFFAGDISMPFKTIREVIHQYPQWKLMFQAGNEALYRIPASQGDPDYSIFWNRIQANPEETKFSTFAEGIEKLKSDNVVIHVLTAMLKGYMNSHPHERALVRSFGQETASYQAWVLTYNSPLTPALKACTGNIFENGDYGRLSRKWEGVQLQPIDMEGLTVLTVGQVFVMFGILLLAVGLTLVCLFLEMIYNKITNKTNQKSKIFVYPN